MLVFQSTYDLLKSEHAQLTVQFARLMAEKNALTQKWNALVEKVNARGGESFLDGARAKHRLTNSDIKGILKLCHPDKHGGDKLAEEITVKLLEMRK